MLHKIARHRKDWPLQTGSSYALIKDFLKPSDWKEKERPDIRLSGSSLFKGSALEQDAEPEAVLPPYEGDGSTYRFMEGTPFSIFYSSMHVPHPYDKKKEEGMPRKAIPEGSENIDDML